MCLQMSVLEEPIDVVGSAASHKEIQKIGIAASKSVEKPVCYVGSVAHLTHTWLHGV